MKQFLRYQISGTVFVLWLVVFHYGQNAESLNDLSVALHSDLKNLKVIAGLASALPIGVIIHQFSVLLKNWVVVWIFKEFNDEPCKDVIQSLNNNEKSTEEYCLERISNLNSFYYVRFDNGFLSPFVAWLTVSCLMNRHINCIWIVYAFAIGFITVAYIPRIRRELKIYNEVLKPNNVN